MSFSKEYLVKAEGKRMEENKILNRNDNREAKKVDGLRYRIT